jgi:3-keto-5-aminohexanoate cleavage enzyme
VRNDDGSNTQSTERFARVIEAIARKCDCIVQPSTGGAVGMTVAERCGPLACKPEMATLNCGTINFGDDVFVNTRRDIRSIASKIRAAGAVPELECYEVGHIEEALSLAAEGVISPPLHFQFVLGVKGAIPAREDVVHYMRTLVPAGSTWAVAATGRWQQPMTELAMRLGGHARVGIEDNIYLSKGVLAEGSAPLVARAAAYARSIGRTPADPARARAMLGLTAS